MLMASLYNKTVENNSHNYSGVSLVTDWENGNCE